MSVTSTEHLPKLDLLLMTRPAGRNIIDYACGEIQRLRADNAALIADRARFPDQPGDIGRMIGAHIENLKKGKDESERSAVDALIKNDQLRARVAELEAQRDCSISFRGFLLYGSAESTAEVRRLLRIEERLSSIETR